MNYQDRASELIRTCVAGTTSHRARLATKVLSYDDLHQAIRDFLFEPVADTQRWVRIDRTIIKQRALAKGLADRDDDVVIETVHAETLNAVEWEKRATILQKLEAWYSEKNLKVELTASNFWLVTSCGSYEKKRTKIRVVALWYGVEHVREITL